MANDSSQIVQRLWNYMADEQTKPPFKKPSIIPKDENKNDLDWNSLKSNDGEDLGNHYRHVKLKRLVELIDAATWVGIDIDVKGEIYEGLLQKIRRAARGNTSRHAHSHRQW